MAKYIILCTWTNHGAKDVRTTVERSRLAREAFAKVGVNAREWHFTMGRYDVIMTVDAPDDETLMRATMGLTALGNMRTETLKGFTEKEMEAILKTVP